MEWYRYIHTAKQLFSHCPKINDRLSWTFLLQYWLVWNFKTIILAELFDSKIISSAQASKPLLRQRGQELYLLQFLDQRIWPWLCKLHSNIWKHNLSWEEDLYKWCWHKNNKRELIETCDMFIWNSKDESNKTNTALKVLYLSIRPQTINACFIRTKK